MKEHGMAFRGDMVRAILEGRKTQTRRLLDPQPPEWAKDREVRHIAGNLWGLFASHGQVAACQSEDTIRCPWQVGDRIYAQTDFWEMVPPSTNPDNYQIWDEVTRIVRWKPKKDGEPLELKNMQPYLEDPWWRKRPAKEMPSWAARTWLEITEIRAQRIREISEEDAKAEGANGPEPAMVGGELCEIGPVDFRHGFREILESIYPGSWDRNDWVFALTFKVVEAKGRAA